MSIFVKDHSPITQFIRENKGKLSETELASIVQNYADTGVASEFAVEQLMLQAKPKTILIEQAIENFGGVELAFKKPSCFLDFLNSMNSPNKHL